MATSSETVPKGQVRPTTVPMPDSWSYIYVGLWKLWYKFKLKYFGILAAGVVFALSAVELAGALTHLLPAANLPKAVAVLWGAQWIRYVVATLLFLASFILIWHHARLRRRVKRLQELLFFLVLMTQKVAELKADYTQEAAIVSVLNALVRALHPRVSIIRGVVRIFNHRGTGAKSRQNLINAAILVRSREPGQDFQIYAQDSSKTFKGDLRIPAEDSVAGKAVWYDARYGEIGALMYVPWTRCVHGIGLRTKEDSRGVYAAADIVGATYRVLDETTERDVLKCLLCIQIPLKGCVGQDSFPCAVLSVSGQTIDCLDPVCFIGARLVVNLIAELF
jgi:hypothetical protein